MKNKFVELEMIEPVYQTYHTQGTAGAALAGNPSIRNWYLNQVLILSCNRKFLSGFTSPDIHIVDSRWQANPYLEKKKADMQFLKGYTRIVIENMLDEGYFVYFNMIDDYYLNGKSWHQKRHFPHDGCICGYNREDKTYCIYAYDQNWIYRKIWIPQKSFEAGRKAMFRQEKYGPLCAIKPKSDQIVFSADVALNKINEYLDSSMEKYPQDGEGKVFGIVVHDYIAKYIDKLYDGSIPYEKMDWRVFRLIWEHKKVMLERIRCIEKECSMSDSISKRYEPLVAEANTMRMLYAAHHMKRRDAVLPVIRQKLLMIKEAEQKLLTELSERSKGGAEV